MEQIEEAKQQGVAQPAMPLCEAIDHLWTRCRAILGAKADLSAVPEQLGHLTLERAAGSAKPVELQIVKKVNLASLEKGERGHFEEILKLFDASSNAYRSITNVLLEHERLRRDLAEGKYDLHVGNYASVDGSPLKSPESMSNKAICPMCRRFKQSQTALALITGNPKMDSVFQTYRSSQAKRTSMRVCDYCFTAGWVDLPTTLITKEGRSVNKGREYLFITTPLTRGDVQRLLNTIAKRELSKGGTEEEDSSLATLSQFLKEKHGIESFDSLAVLGLSRKRLQELRGFVLPSANPLQRVVAVRVPVERLVGEDKVSGSVRRELMKATMYDFWQITGGSLHYNRITDAAFSVDGQPVELEDMRRANLAYRIADRHARVGKYRQLNSGLFMLLLSRPREALNRIFRSQRREQKGRYAPGHERIKEVIEMAEELVRQDGWVFQLGLRIVDLLVSMDLAPRAGSFWHRDKATGTFKLYSGVDLVKWVQRIKRVRDPDSARAWGTSLINGYRREHEGKGPNTEVVSQILTLVEDIIETCQAQNYPLKDFSRRIAEMDYCLLFYYNQRQMAQSESKEETK